MRIEALKYKDITKEMVDKILYEGIEYNGEKAEVAIVPGSNKATKIEFRQLLIYIKKER